MENKDLEPVETSQLPLSTRDSQPPLVVDLPDGQKLVVGDLDPGTVIEIATWRGTGRPDSRTNRFMLGVSTNDEEAVTEKKKLSKPIQISAEDESRNQVFAQEDSASQQVRVNTVSNQIATGVVYSNVNPDARRNQLATTTNRSNKSSKVRVFATWAGSLAAVGALAFILIVPVGLKFAHPAAGAGTALGGVNSSILVVRADSNLAVGNSVVVDLAGQNTSPSVAVVAAVSDSALLLSTESGYEQVRLEQLHGKVVAVLPFIGEIANFFTR